MCQTILRCAGDADRRESFFVQPDAPNAAAEVGHLLCKAKITPSVSATDLYVGLAAAFPTLRNLNPDFDSTTRAGMLCMHGGSLAGNKLAIEQSGIDNLRVLVTDVPCYGYFTFR